MKTFTDYGIKVFKASGQGKTICPKCSPTRKKPNAPCLSVNIEDGIWNCHHCGWAGSLKEEKIFKEPVNQKIKKLNHPPTDLPEKVIVWFKDRGISKDALLRNRIGYESVFMPAEGREVMAIAFPFYKNGELVNIKHRDGKKNFRQSTGAEKIFSGYDDVDGDEAIIVEGEIDKLSLEMAGHKNCISVPDGAPSPTAKSYENKFSYLESCEELLNRLTKIIIAVDNDAPGRKLEEELIRRLGAERCWRVTWPDSCKDANEVLVKHGDHVLLDCISKAKPVPVAGLYEVRDFSKEIDALYENGTARGLSTGFTSLDEYYTVRPGEWTAVTGIPSHGKSEFIDALMVNLAEEHGWKFAIFSPENQPLQRHFAKIASKYLRKPFFEGTTQRMTHEELNAVKEWLGRYFLFILPPDDELTLEHILDKTKVAVMRYGIRGLVIDPWNEIDHSRPLGLTETEYISQSLTKIRRFARKYQVHIWVVAHPTKLQKDLNGGYPVPTMYDISGSAHWRNKADNGLAVWRDVLDETKGVEVHIQKVRFKQIGRPGMVRFNYDPVTGKYSYNF